LDFEKTPFENFQKFDTTNLSSRETSKASNFFQFFLMTRRIRVFSNPFEKSPGAATARPRCTDQDQAQIGIYYPEP
jgi:hypothetical protein